MVKSAILLQIRDIRKTTMQKRKKQIFNTIGKEKTKTMSNTVFLLEVYENTELSDSEKEYLLLAIEGSLTPEEILDKYREGGRLAAKELTKADSSAAAAKALEPVKIVSGAAAVGGAGSWLVLTNKIRKLEAELKKNEHLYQTASDKKEKNDLEVKIFDIKLKIKQAKDERKLAEKVGVVGAATHIGSTAAHSGLSYSAKKNYRNAANHMLNGA